MRLPVIIASFGVLLAASTAQAASPEVEIKDAVARVTVIPEARSDVKVEFLSTNPQLPLEVRTQNGKVIVDGAMERKIRGCDGSGAGTTINVSGVGKVRYADMPQVVIRTPRDAKVGAGGAVFGVVGKSTSLELSNAGCGDWTVADVAGSLKLNLAGSGDTYVGRAGAARLRVAGSGDVKTQAVGGGLQVDIAGSGDVWTASVAGPLDVKIAGSGDVKVAGGKADAMTVSVAGSGGVDFAGTAQSLKARIAGSGDVKVKAVTGEVSKAIVGSGEVRVG
jgi:hypothetical protein